MIVLDSNQLSTISRLFSSTVFHELAKKGYSATFSRLVRSAEIIKEYYPLATVGDVFEVAFEILNHEGYRDEYVFRAAIIHKVLIGKHSLNTASMLTEFRAVTSKADLVILNGNAIAYEIKSERDTLNRLEHQLHNYQKLFAAINVITSESHLDAVMKIAPKSIGVLCLTRRYTIKTMREAVVQPEKISPEAVFDSLRINEAILVLKKLGEKIPELPNTMKYKALKDIYTKLDPIETHVAMVETLKITRSLARLSKLVTQLPSSLHAAVLSTNIRRCDHDQFVRAVGTPLNNALSWN